MMNRKIEQLLQKYKQQCECDFTLYNHDFKCIASTKGDEIDALIEDKAVISFAIGNENFHLVTDDKRNKDFLMLITIACKNLMEQERLELTKDELLSFGLENKLSDDEWKILDNAMNDYNDFSLFYIKINVSHQILFDLCTNLFSETIHLFEKDGYYLLKTNSDDTMQVACTLLDTISSELMEKTKVYYTNKFTNIYDLHKAYQKVQKTMKLAQLFYPEQNVFGFEQLGLAKMISYLPKEGCEELIQEFSKSTIIELDEEDMKTITCFYENNLSIAETSRQLFIHRNTLIYRLDKYQQLTTCDIRKFDDAMKFKLLLMMLKYIQS